VLDGVAQTVGMGMMGMGGLLAALGGLGFLIIAITALRGGRRALTAAPRSNALVADGLTARA
jgi:hypothetical protein